MHRFEPVHEPGSGRTALAARSRLLPLLAATWWVGACGGVQSALTPAGRDAGRIAELTSVMTVGALLVWAAVVAITVYATRVRRGPHDLRHGRLLIVVGGVVVPVVVLAALLAYGLAPLPGLLALPRDGGPVIRVVGEQWWWRVEYRLPDGRTFELANEIRLPVGRRVEVQLESADVVHAFWLPALAGKMDAVPGRVNRLGLEPLRTGTYRGACAEYCGTSHARMNVYAVVVTAEAFDRWVQQEHADAMPPAGTEAARGQAAFIGHGCGACHRVRGTAAAGRIGPDLTHVGSRHSIGAGLLPTRPGELQKWVQVTDVVKPGVRMPPFHMLPPDEVRAIAAYLTGLR